MSNALFMVFLTTCDLKTPVNLFKEYKSRHLMGECYIAEAYPSLCPLYYFGSKTVTSSDHYCHGRSASFHIFYESFRDLFRRHELTVKVHDPYDFCFLYARKYELAFFSQRCVYGK